MAVAAQLDIIWNDTKGMGRRNTDRRELKLRARGALVSGNATDVIVKNLSATGLLIETVAELRVGDKLELDLPETPRSSARVVWAGKDLFGCAFDYPLARSTISAARLRSEPEPLPTHFDDEAVLDGRGMTAEQWGRGLQRVRKAKGYTLVEFARLVKVSRPTVWSWEAGKSSPRAAKKRLIQEILGAEFSGEAYGDIESDSTDRASQHSVAMGDLRTVADEAKKRVASVAGVSPDKVKLIIEV